MIELISNLLSLSLNFCTQRNGNFFSIKHFLMIFVKLLVTVVVHKLLLLIRLYPLLDSEVV